ncbi:MAG TPA: hypothetical protein VK886_02735 [Vicinamibacterales bacterium]|nr:hypothetical protein [Vicinamibacterales bacterium]
MQIDTTRWSGDGTFTQLLIDALREVPGIAALRVEDAPASRAESGYNFIANEVFVTFASATRREPARLLGLIPYSRKRPYFLLDLEGLTARLAGTEKIGEPDYADDGLIQYLRTERVVAPYQTRGVKIIELVRIYRAGPGVGPSERA